MHIIQIDKSGVDITEDNYSVAVLVDKKYKFGCNIDTKLKQKIIIDYDSGKLGLYGKSAKKAKKQFRIRFHTTIVILTLQNALQKIPKNSQIHIEMCNDYDGHFHEIKNMIFDHISRTHNLTEESIVQTKFDKPSKVDQLGQDLRKGNVTGIEQTKLDYKNLVKYLKK